MNKTPWYLNNLLRFEENKDHLIDRLDIEDDQKEILKNFFKKYPDYESKIDWNRKDLTFKDFESLLANEGKSKSQAKKRGIEGITEGVDYKILDQKEDYIAYQPLTYLGSVTIASNKVPPVKENGARWCTAYQKSDKYWNDYTKKKHARFCYVCTKDTKYALVRYPSDSYDCYSFEDDRMSCPEKFEYLYDKLLTDREIKRREKEEALRKEQIASLPKIWLETKIASMPKEAFYKKDITNIVIPDSVTRIDDNTFANCENLTSITVPSSVTSVGDSAFEGCKNLRNIPIPGRVTSIGKWAFYRCVNLESISIPNSATIGPGAFAGCRSLTGITIPDGVLDIGYSTFSGCSGLTSITIPNSVTSIGERAFFGCSGLTSITIPNSVTSIGGTAFARCENLEEVVISNSITEIGFKTFSGCSNLRSVTIPNSVISIHQDAFCECSNLENITIPNSVTSIGMDAFSSCSNLKSITIPNSVVIIKENAFRHCEKLTIYYLGTKKQWNKIQGSETVIRPVVFKKVK